MNDEKDYVQLGASDVQAIFHQADDCFAIEQAVKSAVATALDRARKFGLESRNGPREFRSYIKYQTANILEDTIARLQKVHDLAREDGRIFWYFPGVKEAIQAASQMNRGHEEAQS